VGTYRRAKRNRLGVIGCDDDTLEWRWHSGGYSVIIRSHGEPHRARDSERAATARTDPRARRAAKRAAAPER
jgi:hypothetical protein